MSRGNGRKPRKPAAPGTAVVVGTLPRKPGRPTALTPEVQERIVMAVRAGNYIETAAAYAGVHKESLYEWLKRGAKEPGSIFAAFSNALEKALADAEVADLARIGKAAQDGIWQAAAWRLERRAPKRWAQRTRLALEDGETGRPVKFLVMLGGEALALGDGEGAGSPPSGGT